MKVNPVGIQSYQQAVDSRRQTEATDRQTQTSARGSVTIEPKAGVETSRVAVKAPSGTYAQYLTENEQKALDLLFSRFADSGRFGAAGSSKATDGSNQAVGRTIDVKV